jgi:Protein-tyrosine phosphatase
VHPVHLNQNTNSTYFRAVMMPIGAAFVGCAALGALAAWTDAGRRTIALSGVVGGVAGAGAMISFSKLVPPARNKGSENRTDRKDGSKLDYVSGDNSIAENQLVGTKSSQFLIITQEDIQNATSPPALKLSAFGAPLDSTWPEKWHEDARFVYTDDGAYLPKHERQKGANEAFLVTIDEKYIPASYVHLSTNSDGVIISEAPMGAEEAVLYYRMVIETGSCLLVSVASVYKSDQTTLDLNGFTFLTLGQKHDIVIENTVYTIQCLMQEAVEQEGGFGDGSVTFFRRTLQVAGGDLNYLIYQYVPNGIPLSQNDIKQALAVRDMLEKEKKERAISTDSRITINCKTGVDRSASFAAICELCNYILQFDEITEEQWANLPNHLLYFARVAEGQITSGAAIDTINSLLGIGEADQEDRTNRFIASMQQWWTKQKLQD